MVVGEVVQAGICTTRSLAPNAHVFPEPHLAVQCTDEALPGTTYCTLRVYNDDDTYIEVPLSLVEMQLVFYEALVICDYTTRLTTPSTLLDVSYDC